MSSSFNPPYTATRDQFMVLHHTVTCRSSTTDYTNLYDFQVFADGLVKVGNPTSSNGSHAFRCNCATIGIGVQGCFGSSPGSGGCPSCPGGASNPTIMSIPQECGIAEVWAGLTSSTTGAPFIVTSNKLRPHQYCIQMDKNGTPICPGGDPAVAKDCCGTRYCGPNESSANYWWTLQGLQLNQRIRGKVANVRATGSCYV